MQIKKIVLGILDTNCYIISKDDEVIIIDPATISEDIENIIENKKQISALITHNHFDHIGAVDYLREKGIPIYDYYNLVEEEKTLGNIKFEVIYTPGHSEDSVSYYIKEINSLFCGDFLFKNNIGRCDLPTGSISDMKKSIKKIKNYDKNIIIYPGHGDSTTLNEEMIHNNYFK